MTRNDKGDQNVTRVQSQASMDKHADRELR
jgi:hypothetical protein